jgi:hypothetical protein
MTKFPRTPHLSGSELQRGDDPSTVPWSELKGRPVVVEEKLDGANAGIRFGPDGTLLLQSRGHYLEGGPRERHFARMHTWAQTHRPAMWEVLGSRYLVYGEWMYAKHTVFFDALPHWFLEFDVYDSERGVFLDTSSRRELLAPLPIVSVPVLYDGAAKGASHLLGLLGPSRARTPQWRDALERAAARQGQRHDRVVQQTDSSDLAEGLYVKWEADGIVRGRFKYVRPGFTQALLDSGDHWHRRPILPNELAPGVDIYAP